MSDDWDTPLKIGSKAGRGGAGGPREKTVRGKSQLNAAMRTGNIVATEKKYGSANAASGSGSGQRLTKVDRSDDIIKPPTGDPSVRKFIINLRERLDNMSQDEMAKRARITGVAKLRAIEKGEVPDQQVLNQIENTFGIYVRGAKQGQKKGKNNTWHPKLFPEDEAAKPAPAKK